MKDSYHRALGIMEELNQIERDRVEMNAPVTYKQLEELFNSSILNRFQSIYEAYLKNGKSRDKYW